MNFLIESFNFTIARGSVHHLGIALEPAGFRPFYAFKIQVCACVLTVRVLCLSLFAIFDTPKSRRLPRGRTWSLQNATVTWARGGKGAGARGGKGAFWPRAAARHTVTTKSVRLVNFPVFSSFISRRSAKTRLQQHHRCRSRLGRPEAGAGRFFAGKMWGKGTLCGEIDQNKSRTSTCGRRRSKKLKNWRGFEK